MTRARSQRLRPLGRAVAYALVATAVLAVGGHLHVSAQVALARDVSLPVEQRLIAAERAATLEPWNEQAKVTLAIVRAQTLLDAEKVDEAYAVVFPLSQTVRGDELFRDTYQAVLTAKWPLDARKAHQQHAKEKENGDLAPEDVFK